MPPKPSHTVLVIFSKVQQKRIVASQSLTLLKDCLAAPGLSKTVVYIVSCLCDIYINLNIKLTTL